MFLFVRRSSSDNNFDIIRIALALIVLFYHAGVLSGHTYFSMFPGSFAVQAFFIVSGYLITRSYIVNNDIKKYVKSRLLRVCPLYFFVILLSFLLGLLVSDLSFYNYVNNGGFDYLIYNLLFLNFLKPSLPGVFDESIINGSLWTLKIEVLFYLTVPFLFGFLNRWFQRPKVILLIGITSIISYYLIGFFISKYSLPPSLNNQLPSLMSYFMVGAMFNYVVLINRIRLLLVPSLLLLLLGFNPITQPILVGLVIYILAFNVPIFKISKRVGDISYGIYLWHFPVIQALIFYGFYDNVYFGVLLSLCLVLLLSYLSWHVIEKRVLNR